MTSPETGWDEAMKDPAFVAALDEGLADEKAGRVTPWSEVRLDVLADDVRYAGGNGTSDYWRGFNDGIDALKERLRRTEGGAP